MPDLTDNKGNSPIDVAESSSHIEVIEYLKSFPHQVSALKSGKFIVYIPKLNVYSIVCVGEGMGGGA